MEADTISRFQRTSTFVSRVAGQIDEIGPKGPALPTLTERTVSGTEPMNDAVLGELSGLARVYRGVGRLSRYLRGAALHGH
jgi:hypothetical protein